MKANVSKLTWAAEIAAKKYNKITGVAICFMYG
jgi:hypothetical protein